MRHLTVVMAGTFVCILMITQVREVNLFHKEVEIFGTEFDVFIWIIFQTEMLIGFLGDQGGLVKDLVDVHVNEFEVK